MVLLNGSMTQLASPTAQHKNENDGNKKGTLHTGEAMNRLAQLLDSMMMV